MASFLKKLVENRNRSKSPQKSSTYGAAPMMYGTRYDSDTYYHGPHNARLIRSENYKKDYGSSIYPPVCYLPLPPSPLPTRNESRQSANNSNQSNETVPSWNTEKSELPPWRELTRLRIDDHTAALDGALSDNDAYFSSDTNGNIPDIPLFGSTRARSHSPRKPKKEIAEPTTSRSKSPQKKRAVTNSVDYLNAQCHLEGCSASIVVHSTRFLICRHQLCYASEYFRTLLMAHRKHDDIHVAVSGMTHPTPTTQFRWFIESCIPCPALKDITDDTLETCMRLSKRFLASGLEQRCNKFIVERVVEKQPVVALCWLNWCLKHKFDPNVQMACLPVVARLSLRALEDHRHMISERIYADILAAKLRGCYDKAVHVFRTIHQMDHFSIDMDRCPRCGRTKDGMRVKVNADPCRKQLGCDRCHRVGCELEAKAGEDLQAFYQCPHALLALNDTTEECHCQSKLLAVHLGARLPMAPTVDAVPPAPTPSSKRKTRSPDRRSQKSNHYIYG